MNEATAVDLNEVMAERCGIEGLASSEHGAETFLVTAEEAAWVAIPDGTFIQLLHVDLDNNTWNLRVRFPPGLTIGKHYHTGTVTAFTERGEWYYIEYPHQVNKAGSYLFEPSGSVHTLTVPEDATEDALVSFAITGSNLNFDEHDNIVSILDARSVLAMYQGLCQEQGMSADHVIVMEKK